MTARAALPVLAISLAACPGPDGRDRFERDVVPVLEQYCLSTACHGVAPDAEQRGEVIDWSFFHVRVATDGTVADTDDAYAIARSRINTVERGELSSLVRKPLAVAAGGTVHAGGDQFRSLDDPALRVLLDWIATESDGGEGEPRDALAPLQQQFADEVLPHLAALQCMNQACHGEVAPFTAFQPPMMLDGAPVFSTAAIRANYKTARVHLALAGDPAQSRLARKGLPLHAGGIVHRGGNGIFFDAAQAEAIAAWAAAERAALLGDAAPQPTAIVFVRGPVAPQAVFDPRAFRPGTDLWILEPPTPGGALRNLTAAAHPDGPADVRDPAVRHDGRAIAFAMRAADDDGFDLFEIGVDGDGLRRLTDDGAADNVQPVYGPDGRVYFASTRAGALADGRDVVDSEIWAVDPDTRGLERLTFDPSPDVAPSFVATGKTYGTLAFTMRRTIGGRYEAPVFRVPLDHNRAYHPDPEIHIHHGVTVDEDIVYAMRTLPDGRFACVLLDRGNVWRGGRLAVFDRQLGPHIAAGHEDEAAVGGYRRAFAVIDGGAAAGGTSRGGLYRHPVPLPDGALLVSYAPGPLDLDDPRARPELGLYVVRLRETSAGPRLAERVALLDEPGVAEYDAEPILPRPVEDDPAHDDAWDAGRATDTGFVQFRHVEVLEAIMSNLEQRGAKPLRDDLVYARLIEAVPVAPDEEAAAPTGLGPHPRARILAEVPLAGGSLHLEVPADRPFRVQWLDAERMAVGAQHNRWIHVAPGETFPGGVSPALYPTLCAGCHGGLTGAPADVGGPVPDAITAASVTLATHEGLDPRRPLPPLRVGDDPVTVDFQRDVAPLVARSCTGCHDDLTYAALLRHVDYLGTSARRSPLIERVLGRELDAPASLTGACPGEPALSSDEQLTLIRWIELGAPYRGGLP